MTETFFKYLQFEKRLSRNTLSAYRNDIVQFATFLSTSFEESDPGRATYPMIRSWIISLTEEGIQPVSINRKIATLRAFYKFLMIQGSITVDPSFKITVLKTSKRLPSFIREQEVDAMFSAPFPDDFEGTRDRLILELFYGTGMRLSELLGLTDSAFNLADRNVKVLGKRSKERVIPFGKSLVAMIQEYLARRREIIETNEGPFFVTSSGESCYPMMVYRIVKRHMLSTTSERKSPHILRHTYATHLLDRGAEISAVKDLLGHSSLAATQVYTHNSIDKIKRVFNQAHPKA
ncbi:tyrosine-type recombinase/integrase [Chryseolinea sp. T2]|uniref:tyrosine-type recombinase/integrase n=1 Tax=Chryseolinea sp. T2 TaxID=3129255 RepID=UPI003077E468